MDSTAFSLLARIHELTDGASTTTPELRHAVAVLTAAASPGRAARLAPRAGEPPVLVARLAVWALRRVGPDVVADAARVLAGTAPERREETPAASSAGLALAC